MGNIKLTLEQFLNEELKAKTLKSAANKLAKKSHTKRASELTNHSIKDKVEIKIKNLIILLELQQVFSL